MEMRCFTLGARTQPTTAITACAVLENAYSTLGARFKPSSSNYGLRGAGECRFVPVRNLGARNCE